MPKSRKHKTTSATVRNKIKDLSKSCTTLPPCDDLRNALNLSLSLSVRGAKKGLTPLSATEDIVTSITNSLPNKVVDMSKCHDLRVNIVNAINNLKNEGLKKWKNSSDVTSLVNRFVDLKNKEFYRIIAAERFIGLLKTNSDYTINGYVGIVENLLKDFKEKGYRADKIRKTLGHWSSEEFLYDNQNNVIKLNGPFFKKNATGWDGVIIPAHAYKEEIWVTLPEAVKSYRSGNCSPCSTSNSVCMEKIICWLGLAHFNLEEPAVLCHFSIPELSDGKAVAAVPNNLVSGMTIHENQYRFFIPKEKVLSPKNSDVECGITYDLEAATEDPKQGQGLPEWIVFAENLYLKSVGLLLPLQKKPKGCNFLGRKDTNERYYKASLEGNNLSQVLNKLGNTF